MIAHLSAIRAVVDSLGLTAYSTVAPPGATPPYVLVWSSSGRMSGASLDDLRDDVDDTVGVSSVGTSPDSALVLASRTRAALTPSGMGSLVVPGRRAWLRHVDSRPLLVDRDVTLPGTNGHPVVAVDMYRLISTPA